MLRVPQVRRCSFHRPTSYLVELVELVEREGHSHSLAKGLLPIVRMLKQSFWPRSKLGIELIAQETTFAISTFRVSQL